MSATIKNEDIKKRLKYWEQLTQKTKQLLIERLNLPYSPEEIADDSPLFGLGLALDSVDALEIAVGIEQEFGIAVKDEDMTIFRSIASIVDFIIKNKTN